MYTLRVIKYTIVFIVLALFSAPYLQAQPQIYDGQTGKFLGNLGGSQYDQNSTDNPYGQYGSEYSNDSIHNPYGKYGSEYSDSSPNNPYATNPPVIIDPYGY